MKREFAHRPSPGRAVSGRYAQPRNILSYREND
jgi:hypothetical protein